MKEIATGARRDDQHAILPAESQVLTSMPRRAQSDFASEPSVGNPGPKDNHAEVNSLNYRVRQVDLPEWRQKASTLIKRMYSWRGYETETACLLPHCRTHVTLETSKDEMLIGTLSVGFDSNNGLLADALFKAELDGLRAAGRKLCQVSSLALDPQYSTKEMLASLFHLAYIYARILHKATDVLIEVNPRHAKFYKRMLAFNQVGDLQVCPRVNAPVLLLHLEFAHIEAQTAKYAGYRLTAASLFLRRLQWSKRMTAITSRAA